MQTLRTPDERFADLPDYPFAPHYVDVDDQDGGTLRVHYLDEGPRDGHPILLMHGEPSWSYLYRKMIPALVEAGHRCIAPDLVGFGKSDKPTEQSDYTYARHVAWMRAVVVDHLDLRDATFFGQDWGGLVGLRLVAEHPDRFARVIVGNTGLPTGDHSPSDAFLAWQKFSQTTPVFDVGFLLQSATQTELAPGEVAAYDAPFPDDTFKAGARIFPALVPTSPDDPAADANRAAWDVFTNWEKPLICCFSDSDPVTAGGDKPFRSLVPGAAGQPHVTVERANHFFQEGRGTAARAGRSRRGRRPMTTVERRATVAAPIDAVWSVLADFPGISRWASNVDHSCSMTDTPSGVGAVRRIQTGRTTLLETVEVWDPDATLSYAITGLPPVVRSVVTTWTLTTGSPDDRTDVAVRTDIDAGPRPPQQLIAKVVARKFGSAADEMLAGLAADVDRSVTS